MREWHTALIVEDDKEIAEDLRQVLRSIDCDSVIVDNSEDALVSLEQRKFCLILLDLQIKSDRDAIKGHLGHGRALLRKIRERHTEHTGTAFWLPVLIVSGFAREVDEAVDLMKDNASDVIQKPFKYQEVSERIRRALQVSGRQTHERCHNPVQTESPGVQEEIVIGIPGDRVGRRTCVRVGTKTVELPDSTLKVLLHLMVAHKNGQRVNKRDMGATDDQGFKGISNLRYQLKPILDGREIIKNHYHGDYSFEAIVTIGDCQVDKLLEIGDKMLSSLAKQLQSQTLGPTKKSEGNS